MYLAVLTSRRIPKSDAPLEECEDATSPAAEHCGEVTLGTGDLSVAVADGATTYSYSKEWAEIICRQQEQRPMRDVADLLERLPAWQAEWQQAIEPRLNDLPWFAAAKAEQGAFSTLLQVALRVEPGENREGTWNALALGDSCLVQLRNNKPLLRGEPNPLPFPLNDSKAFLERPFLLPTRPELIPRIKDHVLEIQGAWKSGDEFLLMTDALAAWFIGALEVGESPMEHLRPFLNPAGEIVENAPPQEVVVVEDEAQENVMVIDSQLQIPKKQTGAIEMFKALFSSHRKDHPVAQAVIHKSVPRIEEDEGAVIEVIAEELHEEENIEISPTLTSNERFALWVESQKSLGALKDDDISFVHVRLRLKKEEHA